MKAKKIASTPWLKYEPYIYRLGGYISASLDGSPRFCAHDLRKIFRIKDRPRSIRLEAYDGPQPGAIEMQMQLKYNPDDSNCPMFWVRRGRRGWWYDLYEKTSLRLRRTPAFGDMEVGEKKTIYVLVHASKKQI